MTALVLSLLALALCTLTGLINDGKPETMRDWMQRKMRERAK